MIQEDCHRLAATLACMITIWGAPISGASEDSLETSKALSLSHRDYSFGYWLNGMRKHRDDTSENKLCIETGYFGLIMDIEKLDQVSFGKLDDALDYSGAMAADHSRMAKLAKTALYIEVEKGGKIYRAVSSRVRDENMPNRLTGVRMWESARYVQHYDFQGLVFKNDQGESLLADAKLNVIAWPDSLNFTTEVAPGIHYKDGPELGIQGQGHCVTAQPVTIRHQPALEHEVFTLEAWIKIPEQYFEGNRGWILCKNKHEAKSVRIVFQSALVVMICTPISGTTLQCLTIAMF